MSKPREPKGGEKLTAEEAKEYVDYLYSTLYKENIRRFGAGLPLLNVVDKREGY